MNATKYDSFKFCFEKLTMHFEFVFSNFSNCLRMFATPPDFVFSDMLVYQVSTNDIYIS